MRKYKMQDINYFNIELNKKESRVVLITIVILLIILLFKKQFASILEKIIIFMILFLLILIISKNLILTGISSIILLLLINLLVNYKTDIENFQNESEKINDKLDEMVKKVDDKKGEEPVFDKSIFNTDDYKKSSEGIEKLLKKVNGGIELKDDDLKETGEIGIDHKKYSDDNKPNPLKQAQKEAYELIDTVNALKDTVNTLSPVLQEGKKLMDIFENLKF
jgi:hypothetical protein